MEELDKYMKEVIERVVKTVGIEEFIEQFKKRQEEIRKVLEAAKLPAERG